MEYRKVQRFDELEHEESCSFIVDFICQLIWQPGGLVLCVIALVLIITGMQELLALN